MNQAKPPISETKITRGGRKTCKSKLPREIGDRETESAKADAARSRQRLLKAAWATQAEGAARRSGA